MLQKLTYEDFKEKFNLFIGSETARHIRETESREAADYSEEKFDPIFNTVAKEIYEAYLHNLLQINI